ncbi:unnamed protein product [Chrysoparadoxa australica]
MSRVRIFADLKLDGVTVRGSSEVLKACRAAVSVVRQPQEQWYKDEGGKHNKIEIATQVMEKAGANSSNSWIPREGVPLQVTLHYDTGFVVLDQSIMVPQRGNQLVTDKDGQALLKYRILEVSQRHQGKRFVFAIGPDTRAAPTMNDIAPVFTVPVVVLSKRKKKHDRDSGAGAVGAEGRGRGRKQGQAPAHKQSESPPAHQHSNRGRGVQAPPLALIAQAPGLQPLPPLPGKPTGKAMQELMQWVAAAASMLHDTLQFQHAGYEVAEDNAVDYSLPIWRCPECRVTRDRSSPDTPHSSQCRLGGLLDLYCLRVVPITASLLQHGIAAPSPVAPAPLRRALSSPRGAAVGDMMVEAANILGALPDGTAATTLTRGDSIYHPGKLAMTLGREESWESTGPPLRQLSQLSEAAARLQGSEGSAHSSDSEVAAAGPPPDLQGARMPSVAVFLPARIPPCPAELGVHYVNRRKRDGKTSGLDESGSPSGVPAFDETKTLLGFYSFTWDGQQTNVVFRSTEEAKCSSDLQKKLQEELEAELKRPDQEVVHTLDAEQGLHKLKEEVFAAMEKFDAAGAFGGQGDAELGPVPTDMQIAA